MQPIALEMLMIRSVAPDLLIRPGTTLAARVAERHEKHGLLLLAGAALVAELPDEVQAGDRLRLRVEEIVQDRVMMKLLEQPVAAPPPPPGLPLPGGQSAHVRVDEDDVPAGGAEYEEGSVALTYDSPNLGAMNFHIGLGRGTVTATVRVRAGEPLEAAEHAAEVLRDALGRSTGRAATVNVQVRQDPIDVYV